VRPLASPDCREPLHHPTATFIDRWRDNRSIAAQSAAEPRRRARAAQVRLRHAGRGAHRGGALHYFLRLITPLCSYLHRGSYGQLYERAHTIRYGVTQALRPDPRCSGRAPAATLTHRGRGAAGCDLAQREPNRWGRPGQEQEADHQPDDAQGAPASGLRLNARRPRPSVAPYVCLTPPAVPQVRLHVGEARGPAERGGAALYEGEVPHLHQRACYDAAGAS
jgi:hypothetical protein